MSRYSLFRRISDTICIDQMLGTLTPSTLGLISINGKAPHEAHEQFNKDFISTVSTFQELRVFLLNSAIR